MKEGGKGVNVNEMSHENKLKWSWLVLKMEWAITQGMQA